MMPLALAITGARAINATEYELIFDLRDERGVAERAPINEGAVALARWFVTADLIGRAVGAVNFLTTRSNEGETIRYLTGEIEPSEQIANYLAEVTEGAVLPAMFARPAVIKFAPRTAIPEAVSPLAVTGRAVDPSPPEDRPPDTVHVSECLTLDRSSDGLFIRTPGWTGRIDVATMASLHAGLGRMLGREAA